MQTRFLLGPAGSGKTFRCLAEIRAALAAAPDGPPLLLLAPKQATFQLERQLLAGGDLSGFSRLHIFSFDRLAKFIFEQHHVAPPALLSAEGRLMVLRALLRRHADELKLFRASARRTGFAQELGALLAELQEHQFTPAKLRTGAAEKNLPPELAAKLLDLALLLEKYGDWLRTHELQDANCLLDFATAALRDVGRPQNSQFSIAALWLDGFAEMTPQELALLAAVVPRCDRATLAFCLETEPTSAASWLSIWSAIGKTFQQCRAQIANLPGCEVIVETLPRVVGKNRFAENSALQLLEESWTLPVPPAAAPDLGGEISLIAAANPEAEAAFAARAVRKFVRAGHRFRDCAVLVRNLEDYHRPLARAFRRWEIPFFLDRRESVAHHPLAELTRNALRTVAFDWQADDWFAALKSGFSPVLPEAIDDLENRALEFGWRGKQWREPLPEETSERVRLILFPPFENFHQRLGKIKSQPNGPQLAEILRALWRDLDVQNILERWSQDGGHAAIHGTVWEQMNAWLDNVALAFPRERLPLRDWLPVLEAGLANLTVGVIPPVLDEVLIGAIDRARNPSLKFTLVLGVNESVFPAAPAAPVILTHADRDALERQNFTLGANRFDQISRERYLGYIACTRANEKLALTFSRQSADGKTLNPSPFIAQLQRIFPQLPVTEFSGAMDWLAAEHASELLPLLGSPEKIASVLPDWQTLPALQMLAEKLAALREPLPAANLPPTRADQLYGPVLTSSVSRLEEFAQCPFRFFVRVGLRANERKVFELDVRERGNFQHEVLKVFHEELAAAGQRWRDVTPAEARERIGQIAAAQLEHFRDGLFRASPETLFAARAMAAALQDFVAVIIGWMHGQYDFDPVAAEVGFGGKNDRASAWTLDLGDGRQLALQGRIDRVDLWREKNADTALAVVTDYKSGSKRLDPLLVENGIQLQLLAYLGALRQWPEPAAIFGARRLIPAGAFYVNLRGKFESGDTRDEILGDPAAATLAYRHHGRFDAGQLRKFDRRPTATRGDQFNFRLNKDGGLPSNSAEALPPENFAALIDGVEIQLRTLGQKIFSGAAAVDPYRKGAQTACQYCDYRAVCRIDEWSHAWRGLRGKETADLAA